MSGEVYKIVSVCQDMQRNPKATIKEFEDAVNSLIYDGYHPTGGVTKDGGRWTQAMVRYAA